MKKIESDFAKGVLAGVIGGLLVGLIMEQFLGLLDESFGNRRGREAAGGRRVRNARYLQSGERIAKTVAGHQVLQSKQAAAREAVHFGMAAVSGAIYGGLAEFLALTTVANGLPLGAGVWLLADEVSLPALGFFKRPDEIPLSTHTYALASHFVCGWITETVRSAIGLSL